MNHDLSKYAESLGFRSVEEQKQYVGAAIAHLEAITGRKLNFKNELPTWAKRLSRYHRKKIIELGEYAGQMNEKVFQYLDSIRTTASPHEELGYQPKQIPHNQNLELAKDCNEHIQALCGRIGNVSMTDEQRREFRIKEKAVLEKLRDKYPHAGFDEVLRQERFSGL